MELFIRLIIVSLLIIFSVFLIARGYFVKKYLQESINDTAKNQPPLFIETAQKNQNSPPPFSLKK